MGFLMSLGTRALGFFGGGIGGYVAIGGLVTVGLMGFALWWVNDDLAEANQALGGFHQAVAERDAAIGALNSRVRQHREANALQKQRHQAEMSLLVNTHNIELRIAKEASANREALKEVINATPENRAWADTAVPDAVVRCLRQLNTTACASDGSAARKGGVPDTPG